MGLKIFAAALVLSAPLALAAPAQATGFEGYYAPGNWTTTELASGSGTIDTSGAPDSIMLIGGNSGLETDTYFWIESEAAGTVSFDWLYESDDAPGFDGAFYVVTSLSNWVLLSATDGESGTISFSVGAGELFGFNIYSQDGLFGAGYLTISNLEAPLAGPGPSVPEPATWAMMIGGFALAGAAMRRRTATVRFA